MKSSKSLNEAIFRAHESTEKSTQSQEQLYNMKRQTSNAQNPDASRQQVPLNESHNNLMQSWMNLRQMDKALAEILGKDSLD